MLASVTTSLTTVAVYERSVGASLARVWENVRDWEHLPWLHASSFRDIALLDAGEHGWRARIGLHGEGAPEIQLELAIESERRYVSRTLAGTGAGSEIWTTLRTEEPQRTAVRVEFQVPHVAAGAASRLGAAYRALYTRLWDEDEAMMQHREAMLAPAGGPPPPEPEEIPLGPLDEVRARLPLRVAWGARELRIVEIDGVLHAHTTRCPHWLGPLGDAPLEQGSVRCPWHGYRFDVRSGRRCDADSPLRLARAPDVVVDAANGAVRLVRRR